MLYGVLFDLAVTSSAQTAVQYANGVWGFGFDQIFTAGLVTIGGLVAVYLFYIYFFSPSED